MKIKDFLKKLILNLKLWETRVEKIKYYCGKKD